MSRALRYTVAASVAVVVTLAVAAMSRAPYAAGGTQGAALRLAWRARGARVEECRRPSAEELSRLPPHMRREEICEGRVLPYRLVVMLDGRTVVNDLVQAAGAHADRPLFVFHEIAVSPGRHEVGVRFEREAAPEGGTLAEADAAPALLEVTEHIELQPLDVALVTYDPERRALVVRVPTVPQ